VTFGQSFGDEIKREERRDPSHGRMKPSARSSNTGPAGRKRRGFLFRRALAARCSWAAVLETTFTIAQGFRRRAYSPSITLFSLEAALHAAP